MTEWVYEIGISRHILRPLPNSLTHNIVLYCERSVVNDLFCLIGRDTTLSGAAEAYQAGSTQLMGFEPWP